MRLTLQAVPVSLYVVLFLLYAIIEETTLAARLSSVYILPLSID